LYGHLLPYGASEGVRETKSAEVGVQLDLYGNPLPNGARPEHEENLSEEADKSDEEMPYEAPHPEEMVLPMVFVADAGALEAPFVLVTAAQMSPAEVDEWTSEVAMQTLEADLASHEGDTGIEESSSEVEEAERGPVGTVGDTALAAAASAAASASAGEAASGEVGEAEQGPDVREEPCGGHGAGREAA
jgi:hypothetical protein